MEYRHLVFIISMLQVSSPQARLFCTFKCLMNVYIIALKGKYANDVMNLQQILNKCVLFLDANCKGY